MYAALHGHFLSEAGVVAKTTQAIADTSRMPTGAYEVRIGTDVTLTFSNAEFRALIAAGQAEIEAEDAELLREASRHD